MIYNVSFDDLTIFNYTSMDKPFDYSEVPFNYGMCAAQDCPNAATCLRQIAFTYVPEDILFPSILNPRIIAKTKGKCKYYRLNTKIRLAKGFMCTVNALTLCKADSFRNRMIALLGRKNYYLKRRGGGSLSPTEQQRIVTIAQQSGVVLDEYFDEYIESYDWK